MHGLVDKLFDEIEKLIPLYMEIPEEKNISMGNLAVCIIDDSGTVYGKMFGADKPRLRRSYRIAWTKASQVYITGMKTGDYEKLAFNNEVDERKFGIERPDYIGWQGGQPIILKDGTILSVGFSGFRGIVDLEIIIRALDIVNEKNP